ncbi:hypothetical protein L1887_19179 [Cichorium endivia]|nr:hypothetical protein L1887_19179 [Cichorium endivia]
MSNMTVSYAVMGCTIFNESYTLVFKLFLHFIDVPKGVDNGHFSIVLDMKELSDSNSQNWDNWKYSKAIS